MKSSSKSDPAGYSGTPLPKKLGIKERFTVVLMNPPRNFKKTLGKCPPETQIVNDFAQPRNLTIWFVSTAQQLAQELPRAVSAAQQGSIWIAWPKKASGVVTDVTETLVRNTGLSSGLVDYKICAIDGTWSALLFCVRKAARAS